MLFVLFGKLFHSGLLCGKICTLHLWLNSFHTNVIAWAPWTCLRRVTWLSVTTAVFCLHFHSCQRFLSSSAAISLRLFHGSWEYAVLIWLSPRCFIVTSIASCWHSVLRQVFTVTFFPPPMSCIYSLCLCSHE